MDKILNKAFILTAGIGSRLRPHTNQCPKAALPFLTLPLSYYSFFLCQQAGIKNFVFNIHHLPHNVRKTISLLKPTTDSIYISNEEDKLLGSGGAFFAAQKVLKEEPWFLVANGDEVMVPNNSSILSELIMTFKKKQPLACLLVTDHPELLKSLKPVWINSRNEVVGFGMEKPVENCQPVHFTGYKVYDKKIIDYIPEGISNIFYEVLTKRIAQGDIVSVHHVKDIPWFETGNFNSFVDASRNCLQLILEKKTLFFNELFQFYGKSIEDWELLSKENNFLFKPRSLQLPKNLNWRGVVCLGEGVRLGTGVSLNNVFADRLSIIKPHSNLNNTFLFKES